MRRTEPRAPGHSPPRLLMICTATALAFSLPIAAGVLLGACDDSASNATEGARVVLATRVESQDSSTFVTDKGWSVTVTRALVSLEALYYYDGEPPALVRAPAPSRWPALLGLRNALAHPGHYQAGNALGEMTSAASFDLAGGATTLAVGNGVTGSYRSGEVRFASPPAGALAGELGDAVLLVEGSAEKEGEVRSFRASATTADLEGPDGVVGVIGCVFAPAEVTGPGTIVLTIAPSVWLDQVEFADLPASSDGAPVELPAGSLAELAFKHLGVTRAGAYTFAFEPEES